MKIPTSISPLKRLTLRANHLYWRTYWNWYWNIRHNAFYANLAKYPMGLTVGVCGARYVFGDSMAQWSTCETMDRKRTATFLMFGCLSGIYAYGMYSKFYPMVMRRFKANPISCIIFENTFSCPLIYYGAFYITQGFIENGHFDLAKAAANWNSNRMDDIKALWMFWGPMHFISFKYIQPSMRGVFAAAVGTGWVVILSLLRGDAHAHKDIELDSKSQGQQVEGADILAKMELDVPIPALPPVAVLPPSVLAMEPQL